LDLNWTKISEYRHIYQICYGALSIIQLKRSYNICIAGYTKLEIWFRNIFIRSDNTIVLDDNKNNQHIVAIIRLVVEL